MDPCRSSGTAGGPPRRAGTDALRDVPRLLHRDGAHAGQRLTVFHEGGEVADAEGVRVPGDRAVGLDHDAPRAVERDAQRLGQRAPAHAGAPDHRGREDALLGRPAAEAREVVVAADTQHDAVGVHADDARARAHLHAEFGELLERPAREFGTTAGAGARLRR